MATARSKYGIFGRLNFEDLTNAFMGLEERQQILAVIGAAVVLLLLILLPVACASSKLGHLEEEYVKEKKSRETLMQKIVAYQASKGTLAGWQKRLGSGGHESLTTIIESLANDLGLGQNVERLKPVNLAATVFYEEEGVEASLARVAVKPLTDFLYEIENYPKTPLRIKKLEIRPSYRARNELAVTLQISTVKLKGEEGE